MLYLCLACLSCYSTTMLADQTDLIAIARRVFAETLLQLDVGDAIRRAVKRTPNGVAVFDSRIKLELDQQLFAVAIGKAALPMAAALDNILGERLAAGVLSGTLTGKNEAERKISGPWEAFGGGHPLPNEESLAAARAAIELLKRASELRAPVIFLISGGGSAMMEAPVDESISLEELREANRVLVGCGAVIAEINSVRSAFSAVKSGGLARTAPCSDQITLIVSDTNSGDEATVASGPTIDGPGSREDCGQVITRYRLDKFLPPRILNAVLSAGRSHIEPRANAIRQHYVLLDNRYALTTASEAARDRGCIVEVADDIVEQHVEEGCDQLLSRLYALRRRSPADSIVCLLSGGEFKCPVRGSGVGGRNAETALRWAIAIDEQREQNGWTVVALSAGTDGIDGNSPATGAVAHDLTLTQARAARLDARAFLEASDAYSFFSAIGDALVTGPTGTNVRDLRIMLAK